MALDIFSENPSTATTTAATPTMAMSPRISFSHDLSQSDIVPVEQILRSISSSSSSSDFNFCVHENNFHRHSNSLADEIFSDGKILPTQIRTAEKAVHESPGDPPPPPESTSDQPESTKQNSKSFWRFKRSSSCGSGYARSLCPLPLLSRSNSTGSSTSSKRSSSKEALIPKQPAQKPSKLPQKPPLRKTNNYGNSNVSGGIRVNPVLHVPSANMFGLGSFFSGSKDRNKKKSFH